MCAASRSCARPRTPTVASCAPKWTTWWWAIIYWRRASSPNVRAMSPGANSLSWIDAGASGEGRCTGAPQLRSGSRRAVRGVFRRLAAAAASRQSALAMDRRRRALAVRFDLARCPQLPLSHLDAAGSCARMGQYARDPDAAVRNHNCAGGAADAPVRARSNGAQTRSGYRQLSRALAAAGRQGHGASVLMFDLLKDLWGFARERKKYWLVPLIGTLVLLSLLVALAQFSAVAPFIYTLF